MVLKSGVILDEFEQFSRWVKVIFCHLSSIRYAKNTLNPEKKNCFCINVYRFLTIIYKEYTINVNCVISVYYYYFFFERGEKKTYIFFFEIVFLVIYIGSKVDLKS